MPGANIMTSVTGTMLSTATVDARTRSISGDFLAMDVSRATCTERDQRVLGVLSGMAAKLFVMNFQVQHGAARLTSPSVAESADRVHS
jgi:hypothetical protein